LAFLRYGSRKLMCSVRNASDVPIDGVELLHPTHGGDGPKTEFIDLGPLGQSVQRRAPCG
jgi:hypothetical protein